MRKLTDAACLPHDHPHVCVLRVLAGVLRSCAKKLYTIPFFNPNYWHPAAGAEAVGLQES